MAALIQLRGAPRVMSVFMLYPHLWRRRLRPSSRWAREVPPEPALVAVAVPAPRLLHGGVARPQARAERPLEVRDERRRREAAVGPPLPGRRRPVRVGQRRAHARRRRRRGEGGRGIEVDGPPRGRGYRRLCRARGVWRRGGSGEASVAAGGRAAAPGRVQVDDAPALDAVGEDSGVQVGCPKTPVKGKVPSKGSRRVGPTEVPAMRYPPTTLPESNDRRVACDGEKNTTRTSPDAHDALAQSGGAALALLRRRGAEAVPEAQGLVGARG